MELLIGIIILFFIGIVMRKNSGEPLAENSEHKKDIVDESLSLIERQKNREDIFRIIIHKYKMPTNAITFNIRKWSDYHLRRSIKGYFWQDNETLKILSMFDYNLLNADKNNIEYERIIYRELKFGDIQFYFNTGNFYTETKIQGGGGGGSSFGKALVGGALFGDAGAVIGSRKKIDPITSKLLITDTRESVIKYIDNGEDKFIHISFDEMKNLYSLLPGKSIEEIYQQKNDKKGSQISESSTIKEKLIELKELKEHNLITEEEYSIARGKMIDSL